MIEIVGLFLCKIIQWKWNAMIMIQYFLMIKRITMCLQKWKYKFNPGLTGHQAFFFSGIARKSVDGKRGRKNAAQSKYIRRPFPLASKTKREAEPRYRRLVQSEELGRLRNCHKIVFWASTTLLLSVRLKEKICLVGHSEEKKPEIFFILSPLSNSKFKSCAPCRGRVVRVVGGGCIF